MDRIKDLKRFLQKNYPNALCNNSMNRTINSMKKVYDENGIQVYYSIYDYIKILGLTDDEFNALIDKKENGNRLKKFELEDK